MTGRFDYMCNIQVKQSTLIPYEGIHAKRTDNPSSFKEKKRPRRSNRYIIDMFKVPHWVLTGLVFNAAPFQGTGERVLQFRHHRR